MTFPLYDAVVPQYLQILPSMAGMLDKAESWTKEKGLKPADFLGSRLAPDMLPLANQFRFTVQHSTGAIQGLEKGVFIADISAPSMDFAPLRAMLADAIAYLESLDPAQVNGATERDMRFEFGEHVLPFVGRTYMLSFALPNFYFHASTAYAILRNLGLDVGKLDFIGAIQVKG